jgi:hypothetical protein
MPSMVFLAGIILVIVFALVLIILSSEVLSKRASQLVGGVLGNLPKALELFSHAETMTLRIDV